MAALRSHTWVNGLDSCGTGCRLSHSYSNRITFTRHPASTAILVKSGAETMPMRNEPDYVPLVKMCGITTPEDATRAAQAGARYVGMILWPKSKRSVSFGLAKEIAAAARQEGAEPIAVFVDEDAAAIEHACEKVGLQIAQLHGDGARAALGDLSSSLRIVYVLHADRHGLIQTVPPSNQTVSTLEWTLVDSIQGGSGESFDWTNFSAPTSLGRKGWLLAGGLNSENVARAVSLLRPTAVDVSSGIASSDGISKDPARIFSFIHAVRNWSKTRMEQHKSS